MGEVPFSTWVPSLDPAATLDGTEEVPGVQSGGDVKITTQEMKDFASALPFDLIAAIPQEAFLEHGSGTSFLRFYATDAGEVGNDLSVEMLDPGTPNHALTVDVVGSKLTFTLATNGGSAITSTANDISSALYGDSPETDAFQVDPGQGGGGGGVVTALAETNLAQGANTTTVLAVDIDGVLTITEPEKLASSQVNALRFADRYGNELGKFYVIADSEGVMSLRFVTDGSITIAGDNAGFSFQGNSGAQFRQNTFDTADILSVDDVNDVSGSGFDANQFFWTNKNSEPADNGFSNAHRCKFFINDAPGSEAVMVKLMNTNGDFFLGSIPLAPA